MTTLTPIIHNTKENELKQVQSNTTAAFPFLQYTFGQRLKTSLPPFSKLFFTSNNKFNMLEQSMIEPFNVIHDQELCMFFIKLDSKGNTGNIES